MLVSHRKRFIYTKTLKAAGTSVESYFEPYCMAEGEWALSHHRDEYQSPHGIIGYRGQNPPIPCNWWNHMSAHAIRERLGEEIWSSYFKFCVIRNPYEKVVSHFCFLRSKGRIVVDETDPDPIQLEKWLKSSELPMDRDTFLIDGRVCMDFIARYEHLTEDLSQICARLKLPWDPSRLPQWKAGFRPKGASIDTMFNQTSLEIVRKAYATEFELFGYTFASQCANRGAA